MRYIVEFPVMDRWGLGCDHWKSYTACETMERAIRVVESVFPGIKDPDYFITDDPTFKSKGKHTERQQKKYANEPCFCSRYSEILKKKILEEIQEEFNGKSRPDPE